MPSDAGSPGAQGPAGPPDPPDRQDPRDVRRRLTDPKTMRALAHPLRLTLIEQLGLAGTLTATEASEIVGESPASCSFHLRTLAKYGFVEEAGGGQGRERPWRLAHRGLSYTDTGDDPEAQLAAEALTGTLVERWIGRIQRYFAARPSYPVKWRDVTGFNQSVIYVTPEELHRLDEETQVILNRHKERMLDPSLRPEGCGPVEVTVFAVPLFPHQNVPPEPGG
jgi:DNA-binding transcriptional ArsR family regulator